MMYFLLLLALLVGCASPPQQPRPFFLTEQEVDTHGRKTWFDRLIEADPGEVSFVITEDYQERPPKKIAVLPFVNDGEGDYLINKIPLKIRDKEELHKWAWTHANRVRRAVAGELASREFIIVPLLEVDAVLAARGITDRTNSMRFAPMNSVAGWMLIRWSMESY